MLSKRNLLFQGLIFRFHVKLQGCIYTYIYMYKGDEILPSHVGIIIKP